mgnify:CR=1 FL=1|jgi:hypothetical protein
MSTQDKATVTEADRKQALAMIEEKLKQRDKLEQECIELADEFGVMFEASVPGAGRGDYYLSRKYLDRLDAGQLDEDEEECYGDEGYQRGWSSSWC